MHIIPFNGRQHSGAYDLNLLFVDRKVYIMDNHLAAGWCWLSKINSSNQYNLLHIDRHYDLQFSQIDNWIHELELQNVDLQETTIQEYINLTYQSPHSPIPTRYKIFRWDNYLPILDRLYPELFASKIFATHKDGHGIEQFQVDKEVDSWDLQANLSYWIKNSNSLMWIVNLDIDYFFTDQDGQYYQLFTDEFVKTIADEIKNSMKNIEVLTIALSPEMCGGWENSERVTNLLIKHLNIKMNLPS